MILKEDWQWLLLKYALGVRWLMLEQSNQFQFQFPRRQLPHNAASVVGKRFRFVSGRRVKRLLANKGATARRNIFRWLSGHSGHSDRTKWWPNWEGGACIMWRAITQIDYPTLTALLGEQPYIPAYSPTPFTWCAEGLQRSVPLQKGFTLTPSKAVIASVKEGGGRYGSLLCRMLSANTHC